ncbi:cupin domain-containing protein [Streptomyces sp. NPDC048258]|uniref:cupin domain-containing protein n=1 Tax=Streptomyces sp. NPDC048258 TaxID=3365527 RepID=UPI003722176A
MTPLQDDSASVSGFEALRRCVGDIPQFVERHWGRAPLHRAAVDGVGFGDLLTIGDVDTLISSGGLRLPRFRLMQDGKPIDPAGYTKGAALTSSTRQVDDQADPGRIYSFFDAGATVVLHTLQEYWPPLARFCRQLECALTHPVQANAYITPRSAEGLSRHADTHDVIILQVHGRKHWHVYEPGEGGDEQGALLFDGELAPGDMLYIPRTFPHSARTESSASAHITVGILAYQWRLVLKNAIDKIVYGLDESLPVGFADDPAALAALVAERLGDIKNKVDTIDPAALAAATAQHFWSNRQPLLTGQLQHLLDLDRIVEQSTLRRRPGSVCKLRVEGDRLFVLLGDRELDMPARLEPALRRIVAGKPFMVKDLADQLDEQGRLVLARRLTREGLLELVTA